MINAVEQEPNYTTLMAKYYKQAYDINGEYTQVILTPEQRSELIKSCHGDEEHEYPMLGRLPFITNEQRLKLESCKVLSHSRIVKTCNCKEPYFEFNELILKEETLLLLTQAISSHFPDTSIAVDIYFTHPPTTSIELLGRYADRSFYRSYKSGVINLAKKVNPNILPHEESDRLFKAAFACEYPANILETLPFVKLATYMLIVFRQ